MAVETTGHGHIANFPLARPLGIPENYPLEFGGNGAYSSPRKEGLSMFDTIDERAEKDDPHTWKDWVGRAVIALVVVGLLAGGIYLSVAGNS